MRKYLLVTGACIALVIPRAAKADVPVIDVNDIWENVQELASDVKAYGVAVQTYLGDEFSWVTQAKQYLTETQQYLTTAEMLLSFVHYPSLGSAMGMLTTAGLGSTFPVSPYALMAIVNGANNLANGGGLMSLGGIVGALNGMATQIYAASHIYSPTDGTWSSQHLIQSGNSVYGTQGTAAASYQELQTHQADMPALRTHLLGATTPKDVQDAQAEIELESLWTQNQQASMASLAINANQQNFARQQQDDEMLAGGADRFIAAAGGLPY